MNPPIVEAVGNIYKCLLSEEPISAALDVLCSAMGAAHGIVMRKGRGDMFATSHHLASIAQDQFSNLNRSDEYRQLVASLSTGSVIRMTDMVARDDILRSEMYQKTLRPLDGGLAIYGLQLDESDIVVTAICRSAARESDFDDESVALLRVALPHLVAVIGIATRMGHERRSGRSARDALDIVDDGIIVLGGKGQVLHVNSTANALLDCGDRIRRSGTGVTATERADDLRLQRAILVVRGFDHGFDGHDKAVAAGQPFQVLIGRRTPGWPLIATVMPASQTLGRLQESEIVVHLRDPGNGSCLSLASLKSELGLTPREATLVHELADGASLTRVASKMEISIGTARQYLKTVFLKTGVGSQADLLRLVRP